GSRRLSKTQWKSASFRRSGENLSLQRWLCAHFCEQFSGGLLATVPRVAGKSSRADGARVGRLSVSKAACREDRSSHHASTKEFEQAGYLRATPRTSCSMRARE